MGTDPVRAETGILDSALSYAQHGWRVFPLQGKIPLGRLAPHGCLDATSDPAFIRQWWKQEPRANIGLATGHQFFVLDVDLKNQGDETLEDLVRQHGRLPDTLQQQTGTGGRHFLFALPGWQVRNSAGALGPGLDIRGTGGYIVAAPSIHPDTGREYVWDGVQEWHEQEILPAPAWLLQRIQSAQTAPAVAQPMPSRITEGGRNSLLFRRAANLRRAGWGQEELLIALAGLNQNRCDPPLPQGEIARICASVMRYSPATPVQDLVSRVSAECGSSPTEVAEPLPDWRPMLKRAMRRAAGGKTEPGAIYTHALNAALPLQYDPEFHGAIAFDELRRQIVIRRPIVFQREAPAEWRDFHDVAYAAWCQQEGLNIAPETAAQAALLVAEAHRFHPVREYLSGLQWDGEPRISYWLSAYCGAEDNLYTQSVGRKWLIAAVARAMRPGCKVDNCLILEGKQGIYKSTALGILGGEWYTDEIEDLTSKDAAQQASRVWIIEMGELSAMSRSEKNAVKAFITRTVDQFRPAYGRHVQTLPRQCVFAGSTNQTEYMEDETGNRRFWPVWVQRIYADELRRDRDQIWAEAVAAYQEGEAWWLEDGQAKRAAEEAAEERMRMDPWHQLVADWAHDRLRTGSDSVSTADALRNCIEKRESDWTKADQMRIAIIYRQLGLERVRVSRGGERAWEYRRVVGVPPQGGAF